MLVIVVYVEGCSEDATNLDPVIKVFVGHSGSNHETSEQLAMICGIVEEKIAIGCVKGIRDPREIGLICRSHCLRFGWESGCLRRSFSNNYSNPEEVSECQVGEREANTGASSTPNGKALAYVISSNQ